MTASPMQKRIAQSRAAEALWATVVLLVASTTMPAQSYAQSSDTGGLESPRVRDGAIVQEHRQPPLALADLISLLRRGVAPVRVTAIAQERCITSPLDDVDVQALLAIGASTDAEELIGSLRKSCYRGAALRIGSDPTGAEVWIDDRRSGVTPLEIRLRPAESVPIRVVYRGHQQEASVELRAGFTTVVEAEIATDTTALPVPSTRARLADSLHLGAEWMPTRPEPVRPEKPRIGGKGGWLGGLLGAGVGFGVTYRQLKDADDEFDQTNGEVDNTGRALLITNAAMWGGALVVALVERGIRGAVNAGRVRAYDKAVTQHPVQVAAWRRQQDEERAAWINQHPKLVAAAAAEEQRVTSERERLHAENAGITARNAAIHAPRIQILPLELVP